MATCGSCGALIFWASTTNHKNMPVDAEPDPAGNVEITLPPDASMAPLAVVHAQTPLAPAGTLHTSHFATCPQAREWRKAKGQPR